MKSAIRFRNKAELLYLLVCMRLCFSKYQYLIKGTDVPDLIYSKGRHYVSAYISNLSLLLEFQEYKDTFRMLRQDMNLSENQSKFIDKCFRNQR